MPDDDFTASEVEKRPKEASATRHRWRSAVPTHLTQQIQAKRRRYAQAKLAIIPTAAVDVSTLVRTDLPAVVQELQVHRNLIQALAEEMVRARDEQETSRALVETLRQKIASLEVHRDNQATQARTGELEALRATQARQAGQLAHVKQELEASRVQHARPWWRRLLRRR